MRSDSDIERLLDDWLEDEARPMPREVLESALESVGRTTQAGRRGGTRWLLNRPMRMLSAAALLVLVVVAGALAVERLGSFFPGTGGEGEGRLWDPVADWRSAPEQENPSRDSYGNPGVWSYMRSNSPFHDPSNYLLMPDYEGGAWNEPSMVNVLVALRGGTDAAIHLHPTSGVYAILAWTSPVAGEVAINGTVARPQDPCEVPSGRLVFSMDRGATMLQTIDLDNGQSSDFTLRTTVGRGDAVYFIADAVADANCDLTSLQLTITFE